MRASPLRTVASLPLFALVAAVALLAAMALSHLLRPAALDALPALGDFQNGSSLYDSLARDWSFALAMAIATIFITARFLGRRGHPLALPNRGSLAEIFVGLALGAVPALVTGLAYVLTGATVGVEVPDGGHLLRALGAGILLLFPAAVAEEWLFRDYTLSALVPQVGAVAAVAASSIVFAFAHWTNPGGTSWLAMIDVAIAGAALGTAYVVTGSLWVASAWHFSWNFCLGVVLGLPVSGMDFDSWLTIAPAGPTWWTGGDFGPEASVVSIASDLLAFGAFIAIARFVPRRNWSGVDTVEEQT